MGTPGPGRDGRFASARPGAAGHSGQMARPLDHALRDGKIRMNIERIA
jgi:hypothetical protein